MATDPQTSNSITDETLSAASRFLTNWPSSTNSERASSLVHEIARWTGIAIGVGIIATASFLGNALLPGVGGALLGGTVGAPLGAGLGELARLGLDALGGFILNLLGFDFISHGNTPSGGSWTETRHPDGTHDRTEQLGNWTNHRWNDPKGGYHSDNQVGSYRDHYDSDAQGNSHFSAQDAQGGFHDIRTENGQYSQLNSDGKGNSSVYVSDGHGNSSYLETHSDGSSHEVHKTYDEKTGITTTTTTDTDKDGHSQTTTTAADKDGKPVDPPKPEQTENPEGDGSSEGPKIRRGDLGRPRPGHPNDVVITPGLADNERNEGPEISLRVALRALVLITNVSGGTGWGDSNSEESPASVLRKLRGYSLGQPASGDDFIHPKAASRLIHALGRAITQGQR